MNIHRNLVDMILSALIVLLSATWAVAQTSQESAVKAPRDGAPAAREADRVELNHLRQAHQEAMQRLNAARAAGDKAAARNALNDLRQIEQRVHALRKASHQPRHNGRPSDRPSGQDVGEIREDKQEIRQDKAEIRQDSRELREDMRDLREARKTGDKEGVAEARDEIRDDRTELRSDRQELREDKHELRQDARDLHRSRDSNPSPRKGQRSRHSRNDRR